MTVHRFLEFALDTNFRDLRQSGCAIAVEPQVFDLLVYLIDNRDRVVTRDELFETIWRGRIVSEATLSSRIKAARQAVGDTGKDQKVIQTLPRRGFRFVAEVEGAAEPSTSGGIDRIEPTRSSQPSIAVLPFQNLSPDPDAEFFADGMTEDVINAISKFRWLFVIARGTMFTYKGKPTPTADVASELGVRYVLEGSIRKVGQRVRISAQLLDTEPGNHLWTERFDRQLDDIFAIQDEITNAIAAAIAPEIDRAERSRVGKRQRADLDAWRLYQEGLAAYYRLTEPELEKATTAFQKAQQADPQFAPALAMEAVARTRMAQNFRVEELGETMLAVAPIASRAIALDPRDPLAWWASGRVHSIMGQHEEAIKHTELAISLNPNYAMAWFGLANALIRIDPSDYALSAVDKAIALSPFDPFLPVFLHVRGGMLHRLKRSDEAVHDLEQAIHLGGVAVWCHLDRVLSYLGLGRRDAARTAVVDLLDQYPSFTLAVLDQSGLPFVVHEPDLISVLQELGIPKE